MNEQNNQSANLQDNHNETAQPLITDLEAPNAEAIKGGPQGGGVGGDIIVFDIVDSYSRPR